MHNDIGLPTTRPFMQAMLLATVILYDDLALTNNRTVAGVA